MLYFSHGTFFYKTVNQSYLASTFRERINWNAAECRASTIKICKNVDSRRRHLQVHWLRQIGPPDCKEDEEDGLMNNRGSFLAPKVLMSNPSPAIK